MRKIKVILSAVLAILLLGLGWWISSENSQPVSPRLLGFQLPDWNLGTWLLLTLLLGGLLGYLISLITYLRMRGQRLGLERKLKRCEQELTRLRTAALRD